MKYVGGKYVMRFVMPSLLAVALLSACSDAARNDARPTLTGPKFAFTCHNGIGGVFDDAHFDSDGTTATFGFTTNAVDLTTLSQLTLSVETKSRETLSNPRLDIILVDGNIGGKVRGVEDTPAEVELSSSELSATFPASALEDLGESFKWRATLRSDDDYDICTGNDRDGDWYN